MIFRKSYTIKDRVVTVKSGYSITVREIIITYWFLIIPLYRSRNIMDILG